jgi:hypothetical protein
VTEEPDQDEHWCEQALRRELQQRLQPGGDEAGALGHADAEHGHQHHAQRVKIGEGLDHAGQERGQRLPGQQIDDLERRTAGSLRRNGARVDLAELDAGQSLRRQPGGEQAEHEQERRIGQLVAEPLDAVERAMPPAFGRQRLGGGHARLPSYQKPGGEGELARTAILPSNSNRRELPPG